LAPGSSGPGGHLGLSGSGNVSVLKLLLAFLGVAVLALGGAVLLLVWISTMTPIHVTDESTPDSGPPTAAEWVQQGAVLFAIGEVQAVYGAEWSSSDGSRPGTPWEVSGVPDDTWIQTPVLFEIVEAPTVLQPDILEAIGATPEDRLILALRGGEAGDDRYVILDGMDRAFEPGDRTALVLTVGDGDLDDPELLRTTFGAGWEFLGRYRIENETAVLTWGDEEHETPLAELVEDFEQAAGQ
jgi:hypothetical protein